MKLIIEKIEGQVYAYMEREKHFKNVRCQRGTPLLDASALNDECDLSKYDDDFYMVFNIKK